MSIFGNIAQAGPYQPPGGWPNDGTPGSIGFEDNPRSAWQQLLDMLFGMGIDNTSKANFYQGQYDPWHNRYVAQNLGHNDPNYGWVDFLRENSPQISGLYDQASPEARGERPNNYIGPVRYVGFPG